jgi:hypothetical protein
MKTAADTFNDLLQQAKALQTENDKQAPVRYWTDANPKPLDDAQEIPGEDLKLIHELLAIASARASAIVAAMQAGELPRAGAVEQLEPLRLMIGYLGERLQRCTIEERDMAGDATHEDSKEKTADYFETRRRASAVR